MLSTIHSSCAFSFGHFSSRHPVVVRAVIVSKTLLSEDTLAIDAVNLLPRLPLRTTAQTCSNLGSRYNPHAQVLRGRDSQEEEEEKEYGSEHVR